MAETYRHDRIYRLARHYHFTHYGSHQLGTGQDCCNRTLVAGLACAAGVYNVVVTVRNHDPLGFLASAALVVGGALIAWRNGNSWHNYARLARNFAAGAVTGGLTLQDNLKSQPCTTPEDIPALFAAKYPWI